MKRICFIDGNLIFRKNKTGVHVYHERVLKILLSQNKSYEISIGCFDPKNELKQYANKYCKWATKNAKYTRLPRICSYFLPIEFFFGNNDIYFCDGIFPLIRKKGSKRIALVHDLMVNIYPQNYSIIKRAYLKCFFSKLKSADRIICVSNTTKRDIVKFYGVDPSKIVVSYSSWNAIDSNEPLPSTCQSDSDYLFYIGDMRPNKNIMNMVKGFIKYTKKYNDSSLQFYLAGSKNGDYESVNRFVEENGFSERIKFLGYISEKEKEYYYKHTKAVMLVSKYEGFGIPIMEGLYYGATVITSNVASMKEIGEKVSIQVDPNSVEEIAEAVNVAVSGSFVPDEEIVKERMKQYSFENVSKVVDETIINLLKSN